LVSLDKEVIIVKRIFLIIIAILLVGCQPCVDTDGGINFEEKGIAKDSTGSWTDYCYGVNNTKLREFYCVNDRVASFDYGYCNCLKGACDVLPQCGNNICEVGEGVSNCLDCGSE